MASRVNHLKTESNYRALEPIVGLQDELIWTYTLQQLALLPVHITLSQPSCLNTSDWKFRTTVIKRFQNDTDIVRTVSKNYSTNCDTTSRTVYNTMSNSILVTVYS